MGRDRAWAAGTYEYRAMGVAVVSNTDLFRQRDFRRDRRPPSKSIANFAGYFASIGQVNAYLRAHRSHPGSNVRSRRDPRVGSVRLIGDG